MNPKLEERIVTQIRKAATDHKWSEVVVNEILTTLRRDLVLPMLNLKPDAEISVEPVQSGSEQTGDVCEEIWVNIGPRDFQFEVATGELIACGTFIE
jgi:hypothetical protein